VAVSGTSFATCILSKLIVRIETLRLSDAVCLFIDRASQVRPNFAITAANAPAVAQICHDLDGIPVPCQNSSLVRDLEFPSALAIMP
jgi:predicted ATPase